jgi:hypothetical protein
MGRKLYWNIRPIKVIRRKIGKKTEAVDYPMAVQCTLVSQRHACGWYYSMSFTCTARKSMCNGIMLGFF